MKNKMAILCALIAIIVIVVVIILVTSGSSTLKVESKDASTILVTANNAAKDSKAQTTITVKEGEKLGIISNQTNDGALKVELLSEDESLNPVVDDESSTTDRAEYYIDAGTYDVVVTVLKDSSGILEIKAVDVATSIVEDVDNSQEAQTVQTLENVYRLRLNTDGLGQVAHAKAGEEVKFEEEFPVQSEVESFDGPTKVKIAAKAEDGWKFVKWTQDGEEYSKEAEVEVEITADMEFRAVFELEDVEENEETSEEVAE